MFSLDVSWKHATVLKVDITANTPSSLWPQVQNSYIHCTICAVIAASTCMAKIWSYLMSSKRKCHLSCPVCLEKFWGKFWKLFHVVSFIFVLSRFVFNLLIKILKLYGVFVCILGRNNITNRDSGREITEAIEQCSKWKTGCNEKKKVFDLANILIWWKTVYSQYKYAYYKNHYAPTFSEVNT